MEATMSGGRLHRSASICKKRFRRAAPTGGYLCMSAGPWRASNPLHVVWSDGIYGWVGTVPTERNKRPKNCGFGETYLLRWCWGARRPEAATFDHLKTTNAVRQIIVGWG